MTSSVQSSDCFLRPHMSTLTFAIPGQTVSTAMAHSLSSAVPATVLSYAPDDAMEVRSTNVCDMAQACNPVWKQRVFLPSFVDQIPIVKATAVEPHVQPTSASFAPAVRRTSSSSSPASALRALHQLSIVSPSMHPAVSAGIHDACETSSAFSFGQLSSMRLPPSVGLPLSHGSVGGATLGLPDCTAAGLSASNQSSRNSSAASATCATSSLCPPSTQLQSISLAFPTPARLPPATAGPAALVAHNGPNISKAQARRPVMVIAKSGGPLPTPSCAVPQTSHSFLPLRLSPDRRNCLEPLDTPDIGKVLGVIEHTFVVLFAGMLHQMRRLLVRLEYFKALRSSAAGLGL